MQALVVLAHPLPDSLCAHLAARAVARLQERGHQVTVEDLYAQDFSPVLTAGERASYHAGFAPDGTKAQIARLVSAEVLVLVFPTWWSGFPAIMKGWFDRVWAPGHAFDHTQVSAPLLPRLDQLRHVIAVTSLGSPWWIDRLLMRQPVKRVLKHGILGACAPSARLTFLSVHGADALDAVAAGRIVRRLGNAIDRLG